MSMGPRGRVVLAAQVYEKLRLAIIRGEIAPGEKLTEARVADRLNVSRTPIREALRSLEAEGLLVRDGAGVVAASFAAGTANELLLLRELMEPFCAESSAPHLAATDLARLRSILTEMQEARAARASPMDLAELNIRFHDTLYSRCPYPRLLEEVRRAREHFVTYWLYRIYTRADGKQVHKEHQKMVTLARNVSEGKADPSELGRSVRAHIRAARSKTERISTFVRNE